jgi:hypothetical protein
MIFITLKGKLRKFLHVPLIFQWLLDLNYSPLSALNEVNLTSATQTLNFNATMHYRPKASQPDGKITNLRFASLFVEICR